MTELINVFSEWPTVYYWICLGLILLVLEAIAFSGYLVWIGGSAILVGLLSLIVDSVELHLLVFGCLSVIAAGTHYFLNRKKSDHSTFELNNKHHSLKGERAVLTEAIENGTGRININDSSWKVKGPNLDEGTLVEVVGLDVDMTLKVEAVE